MMSANPLIPSPPNSNTAAPGGRPKVSMGKDALQPLPMLQDTLQINRLQFGGDEKASQTSKAMSLDEVKESLRKKHIVPREILALYYPELKDELKKPITPWDTLGIIWERNRILEQLHQALWSPEGIDLPFCQQVADKLYGDEPYKQEKQAFIMLGYSGAGKTTVAEQTAEAHGALLIDGEPIRGEIPLFQKTHNEPLVIGTREEIGERMLSKAVQSGDNIVLSAMPSSVADMKKTLRLLEQYNYGIHLTYVSLPVDVAVKRSLDRSPQNKRMSDPYCEKLFSNSYWTVYNTLCAERAVDTYSILDNDVPKGEAPIVLEQGSFIRPFKTHRRYGADKPKTIAFG